MAGNITTQPKQGRQAAPLSSLCILICLWITYNKMTFSFSLCIKTLKTHKIFQLLLYHSDLIGEQPVTIKHFLKQITYKKVTYYRSTYIETLKTHKISLLLLYHSALRGDQPVTQKHFLRQIIYNKAK